MVGLVDYVLAVTALALVLLIRYPGNFTVAYFLLHMEVFSWLFLSWLLVYYAWDLYSFTVKWNIGHVLISTLINLGISIALFYAAPSMEITPKTNLVLLAVIFTLLFIGWRGFISAVFRSLSKNRRLMLIGDDPHSANMLQKLRNSPKLGFSVAAVLGLKGAEVPEDGSIRILSSKEEIQSAVDTLEIESVVVTDRWYADVRKELYDLIPKGVNIYHIATFHDLFLDMLPIHATSEVWLLDHLRNINRTGYNLIKRMMDILFVMAFMPIILVFGLITALLVKLSSPGPIFYTQIRVGLNEKNFRIFKFRSMRTDAEKDGAQWSKKNDSRITPVGGFLRSTRLDELPQVINILRGDMSLVGPRPERPEFVTGLTKEIPHYHLRHLVRPGLTGWAQILFPYGDSVEDSARKLEYDLYYLKNKSILLDIKIALKTIKVVIGKMGR